MAFVGFTLACLPHKHFKYLGSDNLRHQVGLAPMLLTG
jgi:hypothetical protein